MSQQYDVVIIGGGIVGTALACALGDTNIRVCLIEAQASKDVPASAPEDTDGRLDVHQTDERVIAINRASQQFLEGLNAWPVHSGGRVSPYDKMRVWDGEGTGRIQFDAVELGQTHLGHIVENRVTCEALTKAFQSYPNLVRLVPAKVISIQKDEPTISDDWLIQLEDGRRLQASLVVGADGARSKVREWAGIQIREWDYQHHGLVCTVRTEQSHNTCAWQRFTGTGVLAFLPLCDPNVCSIVWSCPPDEAQALLSLDEKTFCERLAIEFEHRLGNVLEAGPRVAIPLRQRHAKQYSKDGIVLVGDAAHTIHPLAGQGVNLGLMDAYALSCELKEAHKRGLSLSHQQVLDRYQRQRQPDNLTMMAIMEGFKRLFSAKHPALRWIRNWGMTKVNHLDWLKQHVVQEAMGLNKQINS